MRGNLSTDAGRQPESTPATKFVPAGGSSLVNEARTGLGGGHAPAGIAQAGEAVGLLECVRVRPGTRRETWLRLRWSDRPLRALSVFPRTYAGRLLAHAHPSSLTSSAGGIRKGSSPRAATSASRERVASGSRA